MEIDRIYQGDCLELMPGIADKSIDLILCDLPYGTTACKWDQVIPFELLWKEYKRLIKDRGAIVLTASQPFTSALVMSNPDWFRYELIWEKDRPANIFFRETQPLKYHENILIFSKSGAHNMSLSRMKYNPQMEEKKEENKRNNAPRSYSKSFIFGENRSFDNPANGNGDYIFPRSIQRFNKEQRLEHPTQKPVALFEYLIKTYTNEGDLVLDNCIGSGTTAIAALNTNRHFIGIEKEAKYCEIANKRISERPIPLNKFYA